MGKSTPLLPLVQKYFESDPLAAAHSLESMTEEDAVNVLRALPPVLSAQAFPFLQNTYAAALLKHIPSSLLGEILEKLDPQHAAAIFTHLPREVRRPFLEQMPEKLRRQIQELLTYPENSAGRIMSTDVLAFHSDLSVREAIQKIRSLARKRFPSSYVYVVDMENRLAGVMNMRDLLLAEPEVTLESVMRRDVFTVNFFMDREKVANELSRRRYFAAPVVDHDNHLLGIVKAEQLIQGVQEEITEDIQKMVGAGGDERVFSPIHFSLQKRLHWLLINLMTAFLAAGVVALFEGVIAKLTALAVFLPVIAGQGGNAGAQSLAVVMRGLVMREIPMRKAGQLVLKESVIGLVNGIVVGVVTGLVAWFWYGNIYLGVIVAAAMLINLIVAGFTGAAIPITMKALGLDPAQCSNIILTTFTDVMGFLALLGLAVLSGRLLF